MTAKQGLNSLFKVLFSAIAIGIMAQIEVKLPNHLLGISITGQTLIILFLAYVLPPTIAISSMLTYLGLGILGWPVFASQSAGWENFSGPSLGYFLGFIFATFYISFAKKSGDSFVTILLHFLAASSIILISGWIGLLRILAPAEAYESGIQPFIIGGVVKAILAVIGVYLYRYLLTSFSKWRSS